MQIILTINNFCRTKVINKLNYFHELFFDLGVTFFDKAASLGYLRFATQLNSAQWAPLYI